MLRVISNLVATLVVGLVIHTGALAQTQPSQQDYIKRGNEKFAKEQYLQAIEEYRRVKPGAGETYAQALYNIGVCFYELWQTVDAIAMYKQAINASGGRYAKAFYSLGIALEDQKEFSEAKQAYQQAIQTSGNDYAAASFRLGVIAANENNTEDATRAFKEAISTSKTFPASHNNLGVIFARSGSLLEAENEFLLAVRQAEGSFSEAERNLTLCRSLLASTRGELVTWLVIR